MWRPKLVLRIIWYCFSTVSNETGSLQSSPVLANMVILTSQLALGSPFSFMGFIPT